MSPWPLVAIAAICVAWRLGERALGLVDAKALLRALSTRVGALEDNKAEMDAALEAAQQTVLKLADHEDRVGALEMRSGMERQ